MAWVVRCTCLILANNLTGSLEGQILQFQLPDSRLELTDRSPMIQNCLFGPLRVLHYIVKLCLWLCGLAMQLGLLFVPADELAKHIPCCLFPADIAFAFLVELGRGHNDLAIRWTDGVRSICC